MKNSYLDVLTELLKQADPGLASSGRLEFKNVFGAVAGYVEVKIFISCGKFGVALKLPSETLEELFEEEDVQRLRYFSKGYIKREYAVLPERMLNDEGLFSELLNKSVGYVNDS